MWCVSALKHDFDFVSQETEGKVLEQVKLKGKSSNAVAQWRSGSPQNELCHYVSLPFI
jgi:hypothetical protein